jgi:hypothetical protein
MDEYKTEIEKLFEQLKVAVYAEKPNDRSDRDRYYAILNTELEKAFAIYEVYCKP